MKRYDMDIEVVDQSLGNHFDRYPKVKEVESKTGAWVKHKDVNILKEKLRVAFDLPCEDWCRTGCDICNMRDKLIGILQ